MVRCRLDGFEPFRIRLLRYVPLAEFGLWRYLMETRHGRQVTVEAVSVWIAEEAACWNSGFAPDDLEPVLRVWFERSGPRGTWIPVERYFPAETYPEAQEALLRHFECIADEGLQATPGYFVPARNRQAEPASTQS